MKTPAEWPAPPERLTKDYHIERLVRLRSAINDHDAAVNLNEAFTVVIDAVLETLRN